MAAVLGQTFDYDALSAAAAPETMLRLVEDLEEATGTHVLREVPSGYAFTHALLREAVYDSLGVGLEGDDNETHLMRQIVASLHAAMELRAQSLLSRARAPRETSDLHG